MNNSKSTLFLFLLSINLICSQEQDKKVEIDILRPSKAAFYSAILPGLGQIYNRKAWKIPIVYTAIGVSAYSYDFNKKKFKSYREAYKRRKAGFNDDIYQNIITNDDRLIDAQNFHKRYKDLSMVFLVGFYFLNILDANIDAHLMDFNVNENLSFRPFYENDYLLGQSIGLNFKIDL